MRNRHPALAFRLLPIAAGFLLSQQAATAATFDQLPAPSWARDVLRVPHGASDVANVGSTRVVQNCNDSGTGSLRAATTAAVSNDTIDLSQLVCSRITLTSGALVVMAANLKLVGPGAGKLAIDGGFSTNHLDRVIDKNEVGTLKIYDLAIVGGTSIGASNANVDGGCIKTEGAVSLTNSLLNNCFVYSNGTGTAAGGAIYAHGITLLHSMVTGNGVIAKSGSGFAVGGALESNGNFSMKYSTVSENSATSLTSLAGGVEVLNGDVYVADSTISGNRASRQAGLTIRGDSTHSAQIYNTTISGNISVTSPAGLYVNESMTMANSTITRNISAGTSAGAGLVAGFIAQNFSFEFQSNIVALNTTAAGEDDVYVGSTSTLTGADNLIIAHSGAALPSDTISKCPRLGPLSDNGGETLTHALLPGSPAIDAGNNSARDLNTDQRGIGYSRTHGTRTDIGAFENQGTVPDAVFNADFDTACG